MPPQLTKLSLEGQGLDVSLGEQQQSHDCLEVLALTEAAMCFDRLEQVIGRLPRLRELWLDGALRPIGPGHIGLESKLQQLGCNAYLSLAAALGAATQLTLLVVEGCYSFLSEWSNDDGVSGEQLQRLTALQSLDFALELIGM